MAELTDFPGSNFTWSAPVGADNVMDMRVLRTPSPAYGAVVNISAWRLSTDELAEVAATGVVWLSVLGDSMSPVLVLGNVPYEVTLVRTDGAKQ